MYVKNISPKVLGFGKLMLLQNALDTLPDGFNEKHPTVQFYIRRGWLEVIDETPEDGEGTGDDNTNDADGDDDDTGNDAGDTGNTDPDINAKLCELFGVTASKLSRLDLTTLREKSTELGLSWTEEDTRAVLFDAITCHVKGC